MFVRKAKAEQDEEQELRRLQRHTQGTPNLDAIAGELGSSSLRVRTEAARLLGEVGDASSLPPLKEALLNAYSGRSPRLHHVLGILETGGIFALLTLLLGALLVVLVMMCSCFVPAFGMGSPPSPLEFWHSLSEPRRANDPFIGAVLKSMEQLVEQHAAVEMTPLVPALRTIAADSHHHRDSTRTAALNVISSIRAATYAVGELPISSQNSPSESEVLPLPAAEPRPPNES